jgi:cytochrome c
MENCILSKRSGIIDGEQERRDEEISALGAADAVATKPITFRQESRRTEKMKKVLIGVLIVALTAGLAFAQAKGTTKEAQALLVKAVEFYKANGQAKAFAAFDDTKGQFVDRDLYIYVSDMNAKILSHGANPALIGKTLIDLKDTDGKLFMKELVDKAKASNSGSVDYKWTNPTSKKVEAKTVFFQKVGDVILVSGAYK